MTSKKINGRKTLDAARASVKRVTGASSKATSWIRSLVIYTTAVTALCMGVLKLQQPIKKLFPACPTWLWLGIAALPLVAAFLMHTLPQLIERFRDRRLSAWGLKGAESAHHYFRIGPYGTTHQDQSDFVRADGEHEQVLAWIEAAADSVLYLTGGSGSGKTSLLNAYVIPKLASANPGQVAIRLRAFEEAEDMLRAELLREGVIWQRPPSIKSLATSALITRALDHLAPDRRLLVIFDQFEEVLVLQEQAAIRFEAIVDLLAVLLTVDRNSCRTLLVLRSEYVGLLQNPELRNLLPQMRERENWYPVSAFRERHARAFLENSGLDFGPRLMDEIFEQIRIVESSAGLVRPITVNLVGVALEKIALADKRNVERQVRCRGGVIIRYLRGEIERPALAYHAPKILLALMDSGGHREFKRLDEIAFDTEVSPSVVFGCLSLLESSGIVRRIDVRQSFWEISHDFVAELLHELLTDPRKKLLALARAAVFPAACFTWLLFFVAFPILRSETMKANYISAVIEVNSDRNKEGEEPPTLRTADLRLRVTQKSPNTGRQNWDSPLIVATSRDLEVTATGLPGAMEASGETGEQYYDETIQFTNFRGDLGDLKDPRKWKGAWIEADADGYIEDADWKDRNLDDVGRKKAAHEYAEHYKIDAALLGDGDTPIGISVSVNISVNGRPVAAMEGLVVDRGGGYHNLPYAYKIVFIPVQIAAAPILQ